MKILYFTDTHIRGTSPKNRKDDFLLTLEEKLYEILGIIEDENIDFVLHGGDLFDRPDVSVSIVARFSKILNQIKVPFYIISGNHDVYGHNPLTINRTMMGLLNELGVLNLINEGEVIILEKDDIRIQVTGQPYIYDIDSITNRNYYIVEEVNSDIDYSIHMVHGMLLDRPFIKGIPYTLIDDIKHTKADVTLSGHYHSGFKKTEINGKYFINPGSMVRISNSLREMERRPKVLLMEFNENINISFLELKTAKKSDIVLDRYEIEKNIFQRERIYEFKQGVDSAMNFEKMDINDVLIEVSFSEGVSEEVKQEALKRISIIQMKGLPGE